MGRDEEKETAKRGRGKRRKVTEMPEGNIEEHLDGRSLCVRETVSVIGDNATAKRRMLSSFTIIKDVKRTT